MNKAKTLVKQRAIWAFLVLMLIFFSIMSKNFLSVRNLLNVVKQVSIYGIASVGMTMLFYLVGSTWQRVLSFPLLIFWPHI